MSKTKLPRHAPKRAPLLVLLLLLAFLSTGFRSLNTRWAHITSGDPTIWVKVPNRTEQLTGWDLPEGDPLQHRADNTIGTVVQSVLDDYSNIGTAFVRLAMYPDTPDTPPAPAPGDSPFSNDKAGERTITIEFGTTPGLAGGVAGWKQKSGQVVGCTITMGSSVKDNVSGLVRTLTHELGHCLGLGHPQETTHSIMSYFYNSGAHGNRLQDDDKAGITFLYPNNSSDAREHFTGGVGCSTN